MTNVSELKLGWLLIAIAIYTTFKLHIGDITGTEFDLNLLQGIAGFTLVSGIGFLCKHFTDKSVHEVWTKHQTVSTHHSDGTTTTKVFYKVEKLR